MRRIGRSQGRRTHLNTPESGPSSRAGTRAPPRRALSLTPFCFRCSLCQPASMSAPDPPHSHSIISPRRASRPLTPALITPVNRLPPRQPAASATISTVPQRRQHSCAFPPPPPPPVPRPFSLQRPRTHPARLLKPPSRGRRSTPSSTSYPNHLFPTSATTPWRASSSSPGRPAPSRARNRHRCAEAGGGDRGAGRGRPRRPRRAHARRLGIGGRSAAVGSGRWADAAGGEARGLGGAREGARRGSRGRLSGGQPHLGSPTVDRQEVAHRARCFPMSCRRASWVADVSPFLAARSGSTYQSAEQM